MKFVKCSLAFLLLGMFCLQLALVIETRQSIKQLENKQQTELPSQPILQALGQIHNYGHTQRSVMYQRILGLEHAHNMHVGVKVPMCPGCNAQQPPQQQNNNLTAEK